EELSEGEETEGAGGPEGGETEGMEAGNEEAESGETEEESEPTAGTPKSNRVIEVGGALEWKLPMKANCLAECNWAQGNKELDLQIAKARYPDVAEKIEPESGGPGGDDIDRLAR